MIEYYFVMFVFLRDSWRNLTSLEYAAHWFLWVIMLCMCRNETVEMYCKNSSWQWFSSVTHLHLHWRSFGDDRILFCHVCVSQRFLEKCYQLGISCTLWPMVASPPPPPPKKKRSLNCTIPAARVLHKFLSPLAHSGK